jgi:hypothetical protein
MSRRVPNASIACEKQRRGSEQAGCEVWGSPRHGRSIHPWREIITFINGAFSSTSLAAAVNIRTCTNLSLERLTTSKCLRVI